MWEYTYIFLVCDLRYQKSAPGAQSTPRATYYYDGWTGIQTDLVIFRDRFAPKIFFLCSSYLNIDIDGVEGLPEILLLHGGGYVGEVEGGGRRIDVLVVLAPGLLKPSNIQLGH